MISKIYYCYKKEVQCRRLYGLLLNVNIFFFPFLKKVLILDVEYKKRPLCLSEKSKRVIGRQLYASNTFRRLSPSYLYLAFLDAFWVFLSPLYQPFSASTLVFH